MVMGDYFLHKQNGVRSTECGAEGTGVFRVAKWERVTCSKCIAVREARLNEAVK